MIMVTVDSEMINSDAATFSSQSENLNDKWDQVYQISQLSALDVGTGGHLPEFFDDYQSARAKLSNYLTGTDGVFKGAAGAIVQFSYALSDAKSAYDSAEQDVIDLIAKLPQ